MDKKPEINIGDIVEIQTGKYADKKGKVTHIGGKYGVRVRVDLESTGEYTKVAEYRRPHISFKGCEELDSASFKPGQSQPSLRRTMATKPKTIAYLRVSARDQDLEKNKADVLKFANDRKFGYVEFIEEKISGRGSWKKRTISEILDNLSKGDRLITPELTGLGCSTLEVLEILKTAKEKGIACFSVKEKMELNGDNDQAKITVTMLSLFAELERGFISMRTAEALKARKNAGVRLGRPKGPGKSKLDTHKDEIAALLKTGVPKVRVASKYGVHRTTLENWLSKNKLKT